jgi:nucleoside-diphosphate-sugar epimerase
MGVKEWPIAYLPVDERHPTHATDAYSYSKNVLESIAAFFWHREGVSGACLRIPAVIAPEHNGEAEIRAFAAKCRSEMAELASLPPRDHRDRLGEWMARLARSRQMRAMETPPPGWRGAFPEVYLMATRNDFWAAVDARDSAQAFEKALTAPYDGSHVLFVNDSHNRSGVPSRELAETFYPEAEIRGELEGTTTLVSIDAARALLGFEPEYSVGRFL